MSTFAIALVCSFVSVVLTSIFCCIGKDIEKERIKLEYEQINHQQKLENDKLRHILKWKQQQLQNISEFFEYV